MQSALSSLSAYVLVCNRVLRAAKDFAKQNSDLTVSEALEGYCKLEHISIEDQKFCYDIDSIKSEIKRLLTLGADDDRICKKVQSINPHFCTKKTTKKSDDNLAAYVPARTKRGIIYI